MSTLDSHDSQAVSRPFGDWNTIDPRGKLSETDRRLLDLPDISRLEAPMREALARAHANLRRLQDPAFRAANW